MASQYPEINGQASQHIHHLPADYIHCTEPVRRVGYMEPKLGRAYPQPRPFHPSLANLLHETVLSEIEKQQIREEVIMTELVRRRVLEAEVRQELKTELASRNGIPIGFSISSSVMGFEPPIRLPLLGTGGESRSLEERIVSCLAEKERLRRNGHQSGGFESFPFQRRSDDLGISDARSEASEGAKEKKKIVWPVNPDEDVAGSKRKASTPPATLDSSKSPTKDVGSISTKKAKAGWYCSVCHISVTCEQALNEHLKGRKHKSKATLRAQRDRNNYSMGLLPKNATKSIEVPLIADSSSTSEIPQPQTDPEKDQPVVPKAGKKEKLTKNRFRFWCEICLVGSNSKKIFNYHVRGKKHLRRLELGRQNVSDDREKIAVPVNHEGVIVDGHGKNVTSADVDKALENAGPKDHDLVDANKQGLLWCARSQLIGLGRPQM